MSSDFEINFNKTVFPKPNDPPPMREETPTPPPQETPGPEITPSPQLTETPSPFLLKTPGPAETPLSWLTDTWGPETSPPMHPSSYSFDYNYEPLVISTDTPAKSEIVFDFTVAAPEVYRNEPNNSFLLTDEKMLDDLIEKYDSMKSSLSAEDREYYDAFLNKYHDSSSIVDFKNNLDAKKAFLALKKLDKYGYDTSKIPQHSSPRINEDTEILGQYSNDFNAFWDLLNKDAEYKASLTDFYKQIYAGQESAYICLLGDDKEVAQALSQQMLNDEINKYGDKLEDLFDECDFRNVTYTYDIDNEFNNWNLQVVIKGEIDETDKYLPKGLVMLHELYHVKQIEPGEPNDDDNIYYELGATIDSIVRSDEIHKKLNNIPLDEEVEYPRYYTCPDGSKVNIGTLANEFRAIMLNNDCKNWEQVFISPEGKALIEKYF